MFFNLGVSCATSYLVLKALKKQSNKNKFLGTAISGVSGGTVFFGYSFCRFSNQLTKSLFDGKIEQGNYFFPTVDINEKKRIDFFSNKKYFSVFFNKMNELPKKADYQYQEQKNIKFFLNVLKNIDQNNNFKECAHKDLSKFLESIFSWCLHKNIQQVDFLYEFITKLFLCYKKEEDQANIKNIVNTALEIPLNEVWKFYYSSESKEKIKKLFLDCGKYFSARVSYLLLSQFDLIELVKLFDELRKAGETSFLVDLLIDWAGYKEYKKSAHGDLLFPRFLWQLFLIHLDLFFQEDFQKIIQAFIENKKNYYSSIFRTNQEFSSWYGDDPLAEIGGKIREYGGLGLDSNMQLLCYFSKEKKIINLDIFAEKFSSLDLVMQQNFFDIFLKSLSKDKTEEIDFLYFLCSARFKSGITIDEHMVFNLLSNAFRMHYDLKMFSKNNLFFNKIVSCFADLLDLLSSSSSVDKENVNRAKVNLQSFLHLFFDSFKSYTENSDIKIDFFKEIYDKLSADQKKCIRLYLEPQDILKLDCVNDCSIIKHREKEDLLLEFSDVSNWSDTIGSEKRVDLKVFEMVLEPLEWSKQRLQEWLKN